MFQTNVDPEKFLYHYTSWRTAINRILPSLRLKLGTFAKLNDPRESKAWLFSLVCPSGAPSGKTFLRLQPKASRLIKGTCKILCLTQDDPIILRDGPDDAFGRGFAHPRMWAQYAGKHAGVCLIFDRNELGQQIKNELSHRGSIHEGPVRYADEGTPADFKAFEFNYEEIRQFGLEEYVKRHVEKNYRSLFFRKALDWSGELEYRWLLRSSDTGDDFVSIQNSLRAICLGANFPKTREAEIVRVCEKLRIYGVRICWHNGFPIILPSPHGSLANDSFG